MDTVIIPCTIAIVGFVSLMLAVQLSKKRTCVCPRCKSNNLEDLSQERLIVDLFDGNKNTKIRKKVRCKICRKIFMTTITDFDNIGNRKYGGHI
jgi:hypothetical protein